MQTPEESPTRKFIRQKTKDDQNPGYFSILNLEFDCTDQQVEKQYQELCQELDLGYVKNYRQGTEDTDVQNLELQQDVQTYQKIHTAYQILSDEQSRKTYLQTLKGRYILSQLNSLEELLDKNCGEVFPFHMFAVRESPKAEITTLGIDFVEEIIERRKKGKLLKGYNFSSIVDAYNGFTENEFYITVTDHSETKNIKLFAVFQTQRNLIVELLKFSQHEFQNKGYKHMENFTNPNYEDSILENQRKSTYKILSKNEEKQHKVKLLRTDRIVPSKSLIKLEAWKKNNKPFSSDKRLNIFLGTQQIVLSEDPKMQHIYGIIPIIKGEFQISRTKQKNNFEITVEHKIYQFKTIDTQDMQQLIEICHKIAEKKYNFDYLIHTLPFEKKDINVTRLLKEKLRNINSRIDNAKKMINDLEKERESIQLLIVQESDKTKKHTRRYSMISSSSQFTTKTAPLHKNNFLLFSENEGNSQAQSNYSKSPKSDFNLEDYQKNKKFTFGNNLKSLQNYQRILPDSFLQNDQSVNHAESTEAANSLKRRDSRTTRHISYSDQKPKGIDTMIPPQNDLCSEDENDENMSPDFHRSPERDYRNKLGFEDKPPSLFNMIPLDKRNNNNEETEQKKRVVPIRHNQQADVENVLDFLKNKRRNNEIETMDQLFQDSELSEFYERSKQSLDMSNRMQSNSKKVRNSIKNIG